MASKAVAEKRAREAQVTRYLYERAAEVAETDTVRRNRVVAGAAGRDTLFFSQLKAELARVFRDKMPVIKPTKKVRQKPIERILNVVLSDTHYGASLDPREVRHRYGPVEEARRTAKIIRDVADFKRQYRDQTRLYVHFLGDMFQGQLHDPRDGEPLAQQMCQTGYILIRAIRYLAAEFPRGVTVFCTPGNHGRNTSRHRDRAVLQKWDSNETVVYYFLKEASRYLPNVEVKLGYEPSYDFDVLGNVGMATHGDTVLKPGYPNRSIDTAGLKKQMSDINSSRAQKGLKPYGMFIVGHVHTGSMTKLPGGWMVTNGCLIPTDSYAVSIGITETACGQWIWESTAEHIVGHAMFSEVDEKTDADKSLDSILGGHFRGIEF